MIRYANVWEDPEVLRGALAITPGARVLSIASAGDNALALLEDDPKEIVCVDRSSAQLGLAEFKLRAVQFLDVEKVHALFALAPSRHRWDIFRELAPRMSQRALAQVGRYRRQLEEGALLSSGRFERYLEIFRRFVLPLVQGKRTVRAFLSANALDEQRAIFDERWDHPRWRALFRVFFGRFLLGRLGRDPAFFAHIDPGSVSARLLERTRRAFTRASVRENFFVERLLTGRTSGAHSWPNWLDPRRFERIKSRAHRVRFLEGDLEDALVGARYDAFNLSDVFEWMSPERTAEVYGAIADAANEGARLCSWNLFASRNRPEALADRLEIDEVSSARLSEVDRAFFYERVVVEVRR